MGKLLHQVILLTRKNLLVRFSRRCLTFCELGIPLLFSLLLGLYVSYQARDENFRGMYEIIHRDIGGENKVENKFNCEDGSHYCAKRYPSINRMNSTIKNYHNHLLKRGPNEQVIKKVVFVVGPQVAQTTVGLEFVDTIVKSVVEQTKNVTLEFYDDDKGFIRGGQLVWERSEKTEREVEICVLQRHPSCESIFAVVVVERVDDGVKNEKKIRVDYTIRMIIPNNFRSGKLFGQPLYVDYSTRHPYYSIVSLEPFFYAAFGRMFEEPIGFIGLQALLDEAIIRFINNRLGKNANYSSTDQVDISLVRMPFVIPTEWWSLEQIPPFALISCLLASLTIFSLMRVNTEKSSGFKELLRMHGVAVWTQWMACLLSAFLVYSIWTLVLTLMLWIPLMGGGNVLTLLDVNVILFWLLLLLFMMSITSFSYLVSVLFERVWTAVSVGLMVWSLFTILMILVSGIIHRLTTGSMMALMLIPTVTFDFAIRLILNGGWTFSSFGVPVIENIPVTVMHCLGMLLVDSCIYMTLAVYLDNMVPSKHGVNRTPWYILKNFKLDWRKMLRSGGNVRYEATKLEDDLLPSNISLENIPTALLRDTYEEANNRQPFQMDTEGAEAAVVLNSLIKQFKYSKRRVVDGLSTKMFTGEIYALLGSNGAGKTTTIGMLTGILAPTAGGATIFDLDIKKDMEEIRRYTGLCPQHNLLYDDMSVLDHISFFGRLKGLENPEAKAKELLTWLGIEEKMKSKPDELSGMQKRLVHLAIALIGDTKVAFLDEPTSGLDPASRRRVWDILLKLRGKVTIILTTHDTEEAEVLADRVGIISEGKMMCSGTPSFLKKYYGVGYNLKMDSLAGHCCDANQVCQLVRDFVPSAKLNTGVGLWWEEDNNLAEKLHDSVVSITLPTAQLDLSRVADMMDTIQQEKSALGVDNIRLSLSTMDQVFQKVTEAARFVDIPAPAFDKYNRNTESSAKIETSQLERYRFWALVQKQAAYYCHAPFTMALLIFLCAVFLWMSIIFLYSSLWLTDASDPPQLVSSSSLEQYRSPVFAFLHENEIKEEDARKKANSSSSYAEAYQSQLNSLSTQGVVQVKTLQRDETMTDILSSFQMASIQDLANYRQKYLTGVSFNVSDERTSITGFYSAYGFYTAPLSLNLISQARIEKLHGVAADIRVIDHPLRLLSHFRFFSPENMRSISYSFTASGPVILLVIICSLLTSTAAFLPTEERLNKGKQLQLMTGTTPFIYWITMFTCDLIFFSLVNVVITLVFFLAESNSDHKIFTGHGAGVVIYLILECHTFSALWLSYLVSWADCIKTPLDGFLMVNKFAVFVGVLANVIRHYLVYMTGHDFYYDKPDLFKRFFYYIGDLSGYVLWPVPMYSLYLSMMKFVSIGYKNNICNNFPPEILHLACERVDGFERSKNDTWFMHSCCGNCQEDCFEPQAYLSTSQVELLPAYKCHGLVFDLLAMVFSGLASAAILYCLECQPPRIRAKRQQEQESSSASLEDDDDEGMVRSQDEDVFAEETRIDSLLKDNQSGVSSSASYGFIAQNVMSTFKLIKAVSGLSFAVYPGECFGLLGASGAGKTSTFRVITGDLNPTTGVMFSGGLSYHEQRASYLASIGYCPQLDGIIGRLTGLQMVKLYGALRGISPGKLSEEARLWLDKFGLLGSANLKCAAYSGGMKRRLSVAMALIGNPQLILLDEPTSGADPLFRRQFWNVIEQLKGKGQSIILTSYSMEECQALCTRLGIMVDGQFKCLGNPRHLKNKFGQGYILTIKLKRIIDLVDNIREDLVVYRLQEKIVQKFSPCSLQSKQKVLIQYQILKKPLWYSDIFREMEQIRNDPCIEQVIEDYSVTETSLEDVFVSFTGACLKQGE